MEIPIVAGILECAILLAKKKYQSHGIAGVDRVKPNRGSQDSDDDGTASNFDDLVRKIDKWTFIGCSLFIIAFNIIYWLVALSNY